MRSSSNAIEADIGRTYESYRSAPVEASGLDWIPDKGDAEAWGAMSYYDRARAEYWLERGGTPAGTSPLGFGCVPMPHDPSLDLWWELAHLLSVQEGTAPAYASASEMVRSPVNAQRIEAWFVGAGMMDVTPSEREDHAIGFVGAIADGRAAARGEHMQQARKASEELRKQPRI